MPRKNTEATEGRALEMWTPPTHSLSAALMPLTRFTLAQDAAERANSRRAFLQDGFLASLSLSLFADTGEPPGLDKIPQALARPMALIQHKRIVRAAMVGQVPYQQLDDGGLYLKRGPALKILRRGPGGVHPDAEIILAEYKGRKGAVTRNRPLKEDTALVLVVAVDILNTRGKELLDSAGKVDPRAVLSEIENWFGDEMESVPLSDTFILDYILPTALKVSSRL